MPIDLAAVNFSTIDWVIVALYIAFILGVGIYVHRYISSLGSYLVAGRSVRTGLAITTFVGTELGLVTITFAAQAGFVRGMAAMHIPVIGMAMCMLIGLTGFIIYRLREAGVMTIPEYYEQRYGRRTRILGGFILVLAASLTWGCS